MKSCKTGNKLEALLIGGWWPDLAMDTLGFLTRAGFVVDVISINSFFIKHRSVRNYFLAEKDDALLKAVSERLKEKYSLIVAGDDPTLQKILNMRLLHNEEKLKLLPVVSDKNFGHIFSKIGLSTAFKTNGVTTPEYLVANDERELKVCAQTLGYPVLIKLDASAGGLGVFECLNDSDLDNSSGKVGTYPALVQKKIEGFEVSMEAFYQNGELIHFACSTQEKYTYKFGPTAIRRYTQRACLGKDVFDGLSLLGKALGADGFVNISSIRSNYDNKLYFFEADMRPNLWTSYSRYFGDDIAKAINRYFTAGEIATYPYPLNPEYPEQVLLSHYSRIRLSELLLNRYQVWKHLPENFLYITLRYKILASLISKKRKLYKRILPKSWRSRIQNVRLQLLHRDSTARQKA